MKPWANALPRVATRLPASAVTALADLVAAGFGLAQALAALPRQSLRPRVAKLLAREIEALQAGGPLDLALEHLGLEITAASLRGTRSRGGTDLEAALRSDATARVATTQALGKTRARIGFFAFLLASLTLSTFYLSFVAVPKVLEKSTKNLPANWDLPPALLQFESFRNQWLAGGAGLALLGVALAFTFSGILGPRGWVPFLQDLRLRLPFLRAHAIHACTARLLETLHHEQAAGIPANETVHRTSAREPVPRLAAELDLAATRLEAGDPWGTCLRGTLLDTPTVADLTALAGHGARPTKGLQWAAIQSREHATKGLRRSITASALLLFIPAFAYLRVLMQVASSTAALAQVESIRLEMELLTGEVEEILKNPQ